METTTNREAIAIAETRNPAGDQHVLVTKRLVGDRWLDILEEAGCRIDILADNDGRPLTGGQLRSALQRGTYVAAIGQLNEPWNADLLGEAAERGLRAFSTYAVGFDNVDLKAATCLGILVGNTPGVLTEATAELAVALTFAAARRVVEMDQFTRQGRFVGWHPALGVGRLLEGSTIGVVGAGRIGSSYAEKMAGVGCSILYVKEAGAQPQLEEYVNALGTFFMRRGRKAVTCGRAESLEACLRESDVVSLHVPLTQQTRYRIGARELAWMKQGAILVNTARGPVVDEKALLEALREGRLFAAGLDVYEGEPALTEGLRDLPNAVLLPHVGSATTVSREGMAMLAAANIRGILAGYPPVDNLDEALEGFLSPGPLPKACPSLLNYGNVKKR